MKMLTNGILVYLLCMIQNAKKEWREKDRQLDKEKKERQKTEQQLKNLEYVLKVEQDLFSAHMIPGQFQLALQKTAEYLKADTAFFCSVAERLNNERHFWMNQKEESVQKALTECMPHLFPVLLEKGELISYDIDALLKEIPECRVLKRRGVENLMIILIRSDNGSLAGLLGACGIRRRWKDAEPLRQVSMSFGMALDHYTTFQSLAYMGQTDGLTGLKNRNRYFADISSFGRGTYKSLSCIYVDANGLHELNNQLGHDAGDDMLRTIAEALTRHFKDGSIYRIGGDEYVVLCRDLTFEAVESLVEAARKDIWEKQYEISVGIGHQDKDYNVTALVQDAEETMRENKRLYYENSGRERQMRILDRKSDQMTLKQKDADVFLETMSIKYEGVYFVNLDEDTMRALFIPPYFLELLEETEHRFSRALRLYNERCVVCEDRPAMEPFFDLDNLKMQINMGHAPECYYRHIEGYWLKLRVLKLDSVSPGGNRNETIWIFEDVTGNAGQSSGDSEIRFS